MNITRIEIDSIMAKLYAHDVAENTARRRLEKARTEKNETVEAACEKMLDCLAYEFRGMEGILNCLGLEFKDDDGFWKIVKKGNP